MAHFSSVVMLMRMFGECPTTAIGDLAPAQENQAGMDG